MAAAGVTGAIDLKCGVETVAEVNVASVQNGRQRTSAMVRPDRSDEVNLAVTLSIRGTCSTAGPINFSARAAPRRAKVALLPGGRKRLS